MAFQFSCMTPELCFQEDSSAFQTLTWLSFHKENHFFKLMYVIFFFQWKSALAIAGNNSLYRLHPAVFTWVGMPSAQLGFGLKPLYIKAKSKSK